MKTKILIILFILSSNRPSFCGISLGGTSGLVNIPTASVIQDRKVWIGMGVVNKNAAYMERGICDNFPFYVVIGYLPRLEFSAGVNFVPGRSCYDGSDTYKDGVVSFQYLLKKEERFIPAIAAGMRDIYSFILLNTSYLVASKKIIHKPNSSLSIHLGYGSDIIDQHIGVAKSDRKFPVRHTIVGFFAGMDMNFGEYLVYMLEFDSEKINTGIRLQLNPHFNLNFIMQDMEYLSGSLYISFDL